MCNQLEQHKCGYQLHFFFILCENSNYTFPFLTNYFILLLKKNINLIRWLFKKNSKSHFTFPLNQLNLLVILKKNSKLTCILSFTYDEPYNNLLILSFYKIDISAFMVFSFSVTTQIFCILLVLLFVLQGSIVYNNICI